MMQRLCCKNKKCLMNFLYHGKKRKDSDRVPCPFCKYVYPLWKLKIQLSEQEKKVIKNKDDFTMLQENESVGEKANARAPKSKSNKRDGNLAGSDNQQQKMRVIDTIIIPKMLKTEEIIRFPKYLSLSFGNAEEVPLAAKEFSTQVLSPRKDEGDPVYDSLGNIRGYISTEYP